MTTPEMNFEENATKLSDFQSDKRISEMYYLWQLDCVMELHGLRGNIFYGKTLLFDDISKNSIEGQLIGELLGFLGATRLHHAGFNTVDFVVRQSFKFPLAEGYEDLWANFHRPSYSPPKLLTTSVLNGIMETLFKRGGGNQYALSRLNELIALKQL
jgi:hypothetical protein